MLLGIATLGIAVGTAALILILCVFNGFEDLITNMMGNFNPDVKIIAAKGNRMNGFNKAKEKGE